MARLTSGTASKKHTSSTGPVAEHGNQYGQIKIHEGAIATIVRKAACSVPGVTRITGNSFVDNIAEIVGSKKIQDRSIQIAMNNSSIRCAASRGRRGGSGRCFQRNQGNYRAERHESQCDRPRNGRRIGRRSRKPVSAKEIINHE